MNIHHRSQGVALVEFALVLPVLLLITAAVVDLGVAWQSAAAAQSTLRAAAVAGFDAGHRTDHDAKVVRAIVLELTGRKVELPDRIVIFDANAGPDVPPACLQSSATTDGGVDGLCAVYDTESIAVLSAADGGQRFTADCPTNPDRMWCADQRHRDPSWRVGVWFRVDQPSLTGLLPFFRSYSVGGSIVIEEFSREP